jgi:dihydrofolate reductase
MSLDGFIAGPGHTMDWGAGRPLADFVGEAVATALDAAGGKNLEILGADVAGQCLRRGLVDEILVYVMPVLLGDGIGFSPPDRPGTGQELAVADVTILRSTSARSTGACVS